MNRYRTKQPELGVTLTGELDRRRYRVNVAGVDLWLSFGTFATLCKLAHARLATEDGRVQLDKNEVRHLREALGHSGLGHTLVAAAAGLPKQCYTLTVRRDRIRVDPSFQAVRFTNCIPHEVIEGILAVAEG
jgi:hypothetical protein